MPVTDSLYAALGTQTGDAKAFKEGLEITLKQLLSAFDKGRMTEINPVVGDKFDPHHHQAIASVPSEQEANTQSFRLKTSKKVSKRQISAFFAISALEFVFLDPIYWVLEYLR